MKRILGITGLALAFTGSAAAADIGLSYDLSNLLAPTGNSSNLGVSYYMDDSTELVVGLDASMMGDFALNSVDLSYLMHGDGDGIHSIIGGGVSVTDVTGDLGLAAGGGIGFQSDLGFFDNASVRAWTGLMINVVGTNPTTGMSDFGFMTMSSNLELHYKFGL